MASQHCPECRSQNVELRETRTDHNPVEAVPYRHYRCLEVGCGCWWHTAEKVISVRPEGKWLSRQVPTANEMARTDEMRYR